MLEPLVRWLDDRRRCVQPTTGFTWLVASLNGETLTLAEGALKERI